MIEKIVWRELNQDKLTKEEFTRVMAAKVPLELRLKSVYIPIILMHPICDIVNVVLDKFAELKRGETKAVCRKTRECIKTYEDGNMHVMPWNLYIRLGEMGNEFLSNLGKYLEISQYTYLNRILNVELTTRTVERAMCVCYVILDMLKYILQYERESSKEIQRLIGKEITYVTEDNPFVLELMKYIFEILGTYKAPKSISDTNTQLSYRIFKAQVEKIDINDLQKTNSNEKGKC